MYCMWSIDHIRVILSLLPRDERRSSLLAQNHVLYYIGSAEGHEYPDLQVGDEVNPRPVFIFS